MTLRSTKILTTLVAMTAVACSGGADPDPTTTDTTTSSTALTTTTTTAAPDSTTTAPPLEQIVLDLPGEMSDAWTEILTLPYGDPPEHLGTSPGGDGEGIMWGPDYGVQMPDETWWFLDAANLRFAHYSETGDYLGDRALPPEHLASGSYFQLQRPQALSDGTFVAVSTNPSSAGLLRMETDGSLNGVPMPEWISYSIGDGTYLYGFSEGSPVQVDPGTGAVTSVTDFRGQSGDPFSIFLDPGQIRIIRPGVDLNLPIYSALDPGETVYPAVEAAMGSDGTLFVFLTGIVERSPGDAYDVIGFFSVSRTGVASPVEHVRSPFTEADGGGGPRLGVRFGDNHPYLMFIDTDAVRVFRRDG